LLAPVPALWGIDWLARETRVELASLALAQGRMTEDAPPFELAMARGQLEEAERLARTPLARAAVKRARWKIVEAIAELSGDDLRVHLALADLYLDRNDGWHAVEHATRAALIAAREGLTGDLARALAATALGWQRSGHWPRAAAPAAGAALAATAIEDFAARELVLLDLALLAKDATVARRIREEARAAGFVLVEWEASLVLARLEVEPGAALRERAYARGLDRIGFLALPQAK